VGNVAEGRKRPEVPVSRVEPRENGARRSIVAIATTVVAVNPDLSFAHELADAADAITLARFGALDLRVETKPDLTPVSEADQAAEEAIRALVARERSGEGVFGEELGDGGGEVRWIVDPIDGTKNYVRGVPVWATLLALERGSRVDVAVVSAPALGRRWWAARGSGAWTAPAAAVAEGRQIHVSGVERLEDAIVSTTSSREMPPGWAHLVERAWATRGFSDFWQHCLLAEGAIEIAAEVGLELWDYAAIRLLVEEAGGRCTTFAGAEPAPGHSYLSTNEALHQTAVSLLA
jgi:histidinol-phosphatase